MVRVEWIWWFRKSAWTPQQGNGIKSRWIGGDTVRSELSWKASSTLSDERIIANALCETRTVSWSKWKKSKFKLFLFLNTFNTNICHSCLFVVYTDCGRYGVIQTANMVRGARPGSVLSTSPSIPNRARRMTMTFSMSTIVSWISEWNPCAFHLE